MKKYILATIIIALLISLGVYCANKNINPLYQNNKITIIKSVPKNVPSNTKVVAQTVTNNYIIMRSSAYTRSRSEGTQDGITYTGVQVSRGCVAVDPSRIPLGTKLYIEGYGHAIANDTGGAIKGNRIDLYMHSKKEAFEWGRQEVRVWIIE
jgi:3D (Asp-Asp-Asp) domain-containing protein